MLVKVLVILWGAFVCFYNFNEVFINFSAVNRLKNNNNCKKKSEINRD